MLGAKTMNRHRLVSVLIISLSVACGAAASAQQPTWTNVTPGATPRANHAMAFDSGRGVTVLFGGNDAGVLSDTCEWNGTSWTQRNTPAPTAREWHAMAYDSGRGV